MTGGLYTGQAGLPFVSALRVYEPLEAFPRAEREHLTAEGTKVAARDKLEQAELAASLGRIMRSGPDPFPTGTSEQARTVQMAATAPVLYCPNQLILRSELAANALIEGVHGPLAELLIPEATRNAHRERLTLLRGRDQEHRVHTRSSTWGIPFSWFALYQDTDRTEVLEVDGRILTVRVWATLRDALERARFAVASLALAAPELDMLEDLTQLTEWLELFSQDAVVELDYGSVADKVFPDDSPMDVRLGIECLAEGDMTGAAAAYRRLASRWIPIRQLARAT
jgi:hypothetical protein